MRTIILCCVAAMYPVSSSSAQQDAAAGGSIAGVVIDEKGKTLPNVEIVWYRSVIRPEDKQAAEGSTLSDEKGRFTFEKLGEAVYLLCNRSDVARKLVANCAWNRNPPSITLKNGQKLTGYQFTVQDGIRVEFELRDPNQVLSAVAKTAEGSPLRLGLRTDEGMHHPAKLESQSKDTFTYVMVVPPNLDVTPQVSGIGMAFTDDKDSLVDNERVSKVQLQPGEVLKKFVYKVEKH